MLCIATQRLLGKGKYNFPSLQVLKFIFIFTMSNRHWQMENSPMLTKIYYTKLFYFTIKFLGYFVFFNT